MPEKKEFEVAVKKLTDQDLMRTACESTFHGTSHQRLLDMYKSEHSPVRTQLFWIEMKNIKLYVASHIVRHHVGIEKFMLTMRDDRSGGKDRCPYIAERLAEILSVPESYRLDEETLEMYELLEELKNHAGRNSRTNLSILVNAQSLIDMAKVRLCKRASQETRALFEAVKQEIGKTDPELASLMVSKCVYRGGLCGEPACCGYNSTPAFRKQFEAYLTQFDQKQRGIHWIQPNSAWW